MSNPTAVDRGNVEDLTIEVYDLSSIEPQPGSEFVPGFYYNVAVPDDATTEVKSEEQIRLAGPYPTSHEALAAGKAFVRDAIDGALNKEAA